MKNKENVCLVLTNDQQQYLKKLQSRHLPHLRCLAPDQEDEIPQVLSEANIILANPPIAKNYINAATRLEWMQSTYAGVDAMIDPLLRSDYKLTNVKDVYGKAMAEFVISYVLLYEKDILENIEYQRVKKWAERPSSTLDGIPIGIMGTGSVGSVIAKSAKAFGMKTLGFRKHEGPADGFDEIYTQSELQRFLKQCKYLVIALPRTKETDGLINAGNLQVLRKDAVIINVGRGSTIVEPDLLSAVNEGRLRGAVLDVFDTEPLPKDSPLWTTPNVLVTPHTSGYIISDVIFDIFEENYRRFILEKPLAHRVSFSKGY